jgi:hypothetical protein
VPRAFDKKNGASAIKIGKQFANNERNETYSCVVTSRMFRWRGAKIGQHQTSTPKSSIFVVFFRQFCRAKLQKIPIEFYTFGKGQSFVQTIQISYLGYVHIGEIEPPRSKNFLAAEVLLVSKNDTIAIKKCQC